MLQIGSGVMTPCQRRFGVWGGGGEGNVEMATLEAGEGPATLTLHDTDELDGKERPVGQSSPH